MADNDLKKREDLEKRTLLTDIIDFLSLTGFLYGSLDRRLHIRKAVEKQLHKPTPRYRFWFENYFTSCLGGLSFVFFINQAITGILLLLYYKPTTTEAYKSVVEIVNVVPYGWLIRGMHAWGANLMILFVFMHMLRVFFVGAYKSPRDFNWVTGVLLLIITLLFGFSGYLLPWTQLSYWATTVGTEAFGTVPFIGEYMKYFIRGGAEINQLTLTRFFALHVVILPAIIMVLLTLHFLMIRRQGISEPL